MALTSPLSLAAFSDKLGIATLTPRQGLQQQLSSQASGDEIAADLSPAKREYDVVLDQHYHTYAAQLMALIEWLRGPFNTFYITDPRYPWPAADPNGTILGSSSVVIHSINVNNQAMSLGGLPVGYVITAGDFMHWDYGSSPTRRAYFRAAETVTANGSGITPEFQLSDFIKPGSTTGLAVTLLKPAMKAKLISGSVQEQAGNTDPIFTNIQFSIRQVL